MLTLNSFMFPLSKLDKTFLIWIFYTESQKAFSGALIHEFIAVGFSTGFTDILSSFILYFIVNL